MSFTSKTFVAGLFAVALMVSGFAMAEEKATGGMPPLSMGVVDMQRVLGTTSAAKDIQKQVESKRKQYQEEISKIEKDLAAKEKDLASQRDKISAEEFEKKRRALGKEFEAGQKTVREHQRTLEYGLTSAVNKLEKEAGQVIAEIASAKGFSVVLSREGIVLAEKSLDMTEDVISAVNKKISKVPVSWSVPKQ